MAVGVGCLVRGLVFLEYSSLGLQCTVYRYEVVVSDVIVSDVVV